MDSHAVVIADRTGIIRFWSPAAEAAFGHAPEHVVGRTLALIVPPEFRDAHWAGFRRAMESGQAAAEGEATPFPVQRADGEVVPTPGRLTLMREPQGQVIGAIVVFDRAGAATVPEA